MSVDTGSDATEGEVSGSELSVRKLGPRLQDVIDSGLVLPRAAILVLQPVQVEINLEQSDDPCELDAENYAYENWQLIDGARLVLYSWPEDVISLPGQPGDTDWRNQIANSIFMYEKNLPAGEVLPWMKPGVALAVIGFDESWQAVFVDRHAVVRSGGKRRRSASVLAEIGNRFMWQARFQQFNEQLAEFLISRQDVQADDVLDSVTRAATQFRYLPPVGVLPKGFIDLKTKKQNFFPLAYRVEAIVIPYEQLDVVIQDSASLAHYDFNRSDRIQTLIPVPQIYYEPDLLKKEVIDPEFDFTIERFTNSRNDWLGRRLEIHRKASTIYQAAHGEEINIAKADQGAIDIAELASPFENALVEFNESWRYLKGMSAAPVNWELPSFGDTGWQSGPGGFGFNSTSVETELDDMQGSYVSLYCRKTFTIDTIDETKNYRLEVLTNGGFYAYLNGIEISNHNLSSKDFNATADTDGNLDVYVIDLGNLSASLVAGNNVLAFQAHSADILPGSFVFLPRLVEKQYVADIEADDYATIIKTGDGGEPELEGAEPVYSISALDSLKSFFNSRNYKAKDEPLKLIWSTEEVEKFNNIESEGLEGFVEFLRDKVNRANDRVDFGFIRLQTDIYRLRQFILGNEAATKLATSPVLAGIARGQTAVATKEDITRVVSLLSSQSQVAKSQSVENGSSSSGAAAKNAFTPQGGKQTFLSGGFAAEDFGTFSGRLDEGESSKDISRVDNPLIGAKEQSRSEEKIALDLVSAGSSKLFGSNNPTIKDIEEQSSIIGTYPIFWNATVGERLEKSVTEDAVISGRATKAETIVNIQSSGLSMNGIMVPGFKDGEDDIEFSFNAINEIELGKIKNGDHDPVVEANEASRFNASVRNMENASALLRLTEGRIKTYKVMIEHCNKTLGELSSIRKRMDKRLKVIEDELAESRHDVSVSRALKAEELERIDAINNRREAVLEEHVPFFVFRRPRLSDVLINAPVHDLQPDLSQAPLPLCDVDESESPEEISAMMEVLTEAPVKWYKLSSKILNDINRVPDIFALVKNAKSRANSKTSRHRLLSNRYDSLNTLAQGINKSLQASYSMVSKQRKFIAEINLNQFNRFGWAESRKRANELISLGDVIDGNNGRKGASKKAAQELEQISKVSLCLYLHFTRVLPSLRLDWAERLSQYDAPFNLRNLYSLPRWGEIDFIERNEMQKLVDWLYSRINVSYRDASNMINDLVRICILLSSHAPVNKLIAGFVAEPGTLQAGSKVNIIADLTRVRIGMNMAMVSGRKTVAQGTVVDIAGSHVIAQVVSTVSKTIVVEKNTKVQLGEPGSMGGINYSQKLNLFNSYK